MGADDSTRGIAAERWEELRKFRATHQPKHVTVKGVNWDYIASGEGGEGLLLLPGGAMVGEAGFTRIPAFEDRYRVIAPDYPYVSTAALLLDGLAGVQDAEGVRVAHVLGPSYGGLVAQCFVATPSRAGAIADTDEHRRAAATVAVAGENISDAIAFRPARMAAGA
jgi:pimeloyl-ACP methyl ester carboxylesterase